MLLKGKVHKFGSNINTDIHISSKYRPPGTTFEDLIEDIFKELNPGFKNKVEKGDIIVAGENFGIASSREDAVEVLKHLGISAVIAPSFGYLFFRNAINLGLPVVTCKLPDEITTRDSIELNLAKGTITVETKNIKAYFKPFPEIIKKIIQKGSLLNLVKDSGI